MKLLILGNGFDKMHSLPTSYSDFILFIDLLIKNDVTSSDYLFQKAVLNNYQNHILNNIKEDDINTKKIKNLISIISLDNLYSFFVDIKKSFWINYFLKYREKFGDKWMNIEAELEHVIKDIFNASYKEGKIVFSQINNSDVADFYRTSKSTRDMYSKEFEDDFYKEFLILVSLLDRYMSFVNELNVTKIEDYGFENYDQVLSFNYTNTYERIYDNKPHKVCHIHGEVGEGIVLGFDDHYFEDKNVIPQHIMYEKYYQRIVNKTDITYNEWVEHAKNDKEVIVDIIGHSLSPADGDILSKIIMIENAQINIVYRNDEDRAEKIKNLAIILKPEKLIEYTNSLKPKISFIRIDTPEPLDFSNIIMA